MTNPNPASAEREKKPPSSFQVLCARAAFILGVCDVLAALTWLGLASQNSPSTPDTVSAAQVWTAWWVVCGLTLVTALVGLGVE